MASDMASRFRGVDAIAMLPCATFASHRTLPGPKLSTVASALRKGLRALADGDRLRVAPDESGKAHVSSSVCGSSGRGQQETLGLVDLLTALVIHLTFGLDTFGEGLESEVAADLHQRSNRCLRFGRRGDRVPESPIDLDRQSGTATGTQPE